MLVGPFLNAYKPDVALALGVRNDNQLKYQVASNGWTLALQASAGEDAPFSTTMGKSWGGSLKYANGPIGIGGGYLERRDNVDRKAQAYVLGAAYTQGKFYLNGALASDRFDDGLNTALLMVGTGVENTVVPARPGQAVTRVSRRDMWSLGATYDVAPAFFVGAQYWAIRQSFYTPGAPEARGRFLALLADYFLSRRTDLYASVDRTSLSNLQLTSTASGVPNRATGRTALMVGMRHRF
jgi:predicted porin